MAGIAAAQRPAFRGCRGGHGERAWPPRRLTALDTEMRTRRALLDRIDDRIRASSLTRAQRAALVQMLADIAYRANHDDRSWPRRRGATSATAGPNSSPP